jgi:hypothetical protein
LILPTSARNDDDGTSSGDEAVPEDNGGQYPREIITGRKGNNNNNNNNVVVYAHVLQSYDLGFPRGESGHTNQMTSFRPRRHNRRRK